MHIVQARIKRGRIEPTEPVPAEWEGRLVRITPATPEDPLPDLEERLASLHTLGPAEFEPGEREAIAKAWADLNCISKVAMNSLRGDRS